MGRLPLEYGAALYWFRKEGLVQNLIHNIKYKGQKAGAVLAGNEFGKALIKTNLNKPEVVIPVPLHKSKLRKRGFNQSYYFAKGIGKVLEIPVESQVLSRKRATSTQTRKSRLERWENVEHVFAIKNKEPVIGKHALLVDDVVTTGATLESCGIRLLDSGSQKISVGVIAMAE